MQESKLETADTQTMNGETNSQRAVEEDFDDGIATMASSKVSHCRSFHSAEDDLRTTGLSKASDRSAYYSTSETIRDNESGSWSNQEEETDDVSVPFDEASMLPFAYGDNNSTLYSIADCSEDPHDRHSLFDVEEAVARANRPKSAQILKPTSKHAGPRGNKQSATPPMPRQMKTTPPVPPVPPSRDNPSKSASRRVPSKSQKRCTGIIIGLFIFASLALIGLASVLYFYFLRESSSPQPVNQGSGFPAQDPLDEFDYNDFNPNTEFSPSPNTSFPTTAPIVIPTASPTIPATRPPTVSGSAALTQFLAANFSIDFPDDPSAPANQAVGWLVEESSGMNTSLMIGGDKLAQRFALMVLELNWREPTNTSLVEPLVHECQWEGVVCNGKRVTELQWGSQELSGTIPLEIGLLTNLQHLDLSQNALEGSIPENLYSLTKLETLYLYQNQLSGTLSDELGNLKNLTHIHLSHNQLSGSIPLTMRSSTSFIRPYCKSCTVRGLTVSIIDLTDSQCLPLLPLPI